MKKTGHCKSCGYWPVAKDALACPNCGVIEPNPGLIQRAVGLFVRMVILGIVLIAIVGLMNP